MNSHNGKSLVLDRLPVTCAHTGDCVKGVVNCQNSQDKGPPEGNSARG